MPWPLRILGVNGVLAFLQGSAGSISILAAFSETTNSCGSPDPKVNALAAAAGVVMIVTAWRLV